MRTNKLLTVLLRSLVHACTSAQNNPTSSCISSISFEELIELQYTKF